MANTRNVIDPLKSDADVPDDAPYRFPLGMTMGDKRLLWQKASPATPTAWLLSIIRGEAPIPVEESVPGRITVQLDKRRAKLIEGTSSQLGFYSVEDMTKELLHQVINDPEMAEEFLFGKLRRRIQKEAREELEQQQSTKSKRAA